MRALVDAGVAPGDRVGCYLPNSPSWVVASLAVWFAGGAVAAAGTLLPPVEAAALFALADAKIVVTTSDTAELDGDFTVLRIDDRGLLVDAPDPVANAWEDADLRLPEPDDLAVAIFTSGTTGRPKGITHTHGDIVTAARGVAAGYARNSDYRPDPAPARPRARRALQRIRAHGRLQPPRLPYVDRSADPDRPEVHGRRGPRAARPSSTWTRCSSLRR